MNRTTRTAAALAAAALLAVAVGCSDDTTEPDTQATGRLVLNLTDAPGDFDAVNVEVVRVSVHRGDEGSPEDPDAGWITVSEDTFMVDLLDFSAGEHLVLADTLLPAGLYTQVRLLLGDGNTLVVDGVEHDLVVPSGDTTGLKLNHPFTLEPDALYAATLDFDAHRSVHMTGNGMWMLKPVIRIMVDAISGRLEGVVDPAEARPMVWAVAGDDSALAWADTLSGAFVFPMLEEGTYDVSVVPTADGWLDSTLTGVAVGAMATTDLDTIRLEAAAE